MEEGGLTELEWRDGERTIRLSKKHEAPAATAALPHPATVPPPATGPSAPSETAEEQGVLIFRSPMVGTFYRAPGPEVEAYVQTGDRVTADTTLCILEAMKVMNEIKAECSGELLEILVENGEPVEFDQPLFRIKTA